MRFAILAILLIGCGDDAPTTRPPTPPAATKLQAALGGDVGADAKLKIPPGALKEDADVKLVKAGDEWIATVNGQEHYTFNYPIEIILPYEKVAPGKRVRIAVHQNGAWIPLFSRMDRQGRRVSAEISHFSRFRTEEFTAGLHTVGRWHGITTRTQTIPGVQPTERFMGRTGYTITNTCKWSFREESHDLLQYTRTICESASWSVHISEAWILEGQGPNRRVPLHAEHRFSGSYAEAELNGPPDAERLAKVRSEIDQVKARLEREPHLDTELERLEHEEASILFDPHPKIASGWIERHEDGTLSIACTFDAHQAKYTYRYQDALWPNVNRKEIKVNQYSVERALSINAPKITAKPEGPFELRNGDDVVRYWGHGADSKTIKGEIFHRVKDDIPVGGTVHVGAWLSDAPDGPPDFYSKAVDGKFEITVPNKPVTLELKYKNSDAQITERQVISKTGSRKGFVTVRYAMAEKEIDLGEETGPDGKYFLGTYIYKAPHLNQNVVSVPVKVDVPEAQILAFCPPSRREEVSARLENPTTITFRGDVVCFPTCCTMALGALGFEADLQDLAQSAYDYKKARTPTPWYFPFPDQLPEWIVYEQFQRIWETAPNSYVYEVLERLAYRLDEPIFSKHWPFADGTPYTEKEWLATIESGDYRPWQVAQTMTDLLQSKFPGVQIVNRDRDVFQSSSTPTVLEQLAAGGVAVVSIDHTSRKNNRKRVGGHILVLLGAIVNAKSEAVRLIFHDPYGDMTQHPEDEGYHDPNWITGGADVVKDIDDTGHKGAYAPYYPPDIKAWDGKLYSKYWLVFRRSDSRRPPLLKSE